MSYKLAQVLSISYSIPAWTNHELVKLRRSWSRSLASRLQSLLLQNYINWLCLHFVVFFLFYTIKVTNIPFTLSLYSSSARPFPSGDPYVEKSTLRDSRRERDCSSHFHKEEINPGKSSLWISSTSRYLFFLLFKYIFHKFKVRPNKKFWFSKPQL